MKPKSERLRSVMPPLWVLLLSFWVLTGSETRHPIEASQKSEPVFVGVLRHDGLLVVTAAYDGRDWWNSWPFSNADDELVGKLPVPESLKAIPPSWLPPSTQLPDRWLVQLESGSTRRLGLARPERPSEAILSSTIGIRTDFAPTPSRRFDSWMEAGVAIAGPGQLGRFRAVDAAESLELDAAVRAHLNREETEAIAVRLTERRGRSAPALETVQERARRPYVDANWVRADRTAGGDAFYYFTGTKDYGLKPYPDCDVTVDFHAMVVRRAAASPVVIRGGAYTTLECSRDNRIHLTFSPLATVTVGTQQVWVVKSDSGDGYTYDLISPGAIDEAGQLRLKGLWQYWRGAGR